MNTLTYKILPISAEIIMWQCGVVAGIVYPLKKIENEIINGAQV